MELAPGKKITHQSCSGGNLDAPPYPHLKQMDVGTMPSTATWPTHFSRRVVPKTPTGDSLSSVCIALEAWRRDLTVTFNSGNLHHYTICDGARELKFDCSMPATYTGREDKLRLIRKAVANDILESHQLPVPRSIMFSISGTSSAELRKHVATIGFPLVLKPNVGSVGRGVFVNLRSWDELAASVQHLAKTGTDKVIVQSHHRGDDLRILVVGDSVASAIRRVPANVTGDGVHSIRDLIALKNRGRRQNPFLSKGMIRVDHEIENSLKEQQLTIDTIPKLGQYIYLRKVANASAGGDVVDITSDLPAAVKDAAIAAVKVMPNVKVAGVDVLYEASTGEFVIIEMNSRPHIGVNMYPSVGAGADVPKLFLDYFFPDSARREDVDDSMLAFEIAPIRRLLLSQASEAVSLAPLPEHRFPFRRVYSFEESTGEFQISPKQEHRILSIAARLRITGRLRRRNGRVELIVAGDRDSSMREIARLVSEVANVNISGRSPWRSVLTHGFFVEASLVRTRHSTQS